MSDKDPNNTKYLPGKGLDVGTSYIISACEFEEGGKVSVFPIGFGQCGSQPVWFLKKNHRDKGLSIKCGKAKGGKTVTTKVAKSAKGRRGKAERQVSRKDQ